MAISHKVSALRIFVRHFSKENPIDLAISQIRRSAETTASSFENIQRGIQQTKTEISQQLEKSIQTLEQVTEFQVQESEKIQKQITNSLAEKTTKDLHDLNNKLIDEMIKEKYQMEPIVDSLKERVQGLNDALTIENQERKSQGTFLKREIQTLFFGTFSLLLMIIMMSINSKQLENRIIENKEHQNLTNKNFLKKFQSLEEENKNLMRELEKEKKRNQLNKSIQTLEKEIEKVERKLSWWWIWSSRKETKQQLKVMYQEMDQLQTQLSDIPFSS